jgi:hypothetical protein
MLTAAVRQQSSAERAEALRKSGELDPSSSCAAKSLASLRLSTDVDFDDGIRTIKRGLREATVADGVVKMLQDEAISRHGAQSRVERGNGLPTNIADALGVDWHSVPHQFHGTLRHVRGSFPAVTKAVGTLMAACGKTKVPQQLAHRLLNHRQTIHEPSYHDEVPKATKEESALHNFTCNTAGFCVHGSDGILVKAMHTSLNAAICHRRFPKSNKIGRDMLSKSGIVICVAAARRDVAAGPVDAHGFGPEPIDVPTVKWAHLGCEDLIPRGFQSHILFRCDGHQLCIGDGHTEAALERQWVFQHAWSFVRYLDKTLVWVLRCFQFAESPRLLGTLDLNQCSVVELQPWPRGSDRELIFWDGQASIDRARASHRKSEIKRALDAGNALKGRGSISIDFDFIFFYY